MQPDRDQWTQALLGLPAQVRGPKWQLSIIATCGHHSITEWDRLEGTKWEIWSKLPAQAGSSQSPRHRTVLRGFLGTPSEGDPTTTPGSLFQGLVTRTERSSPSCSGHISCASVSAPFLSSYCWAPRAEPGSLLLAPPASILINIDEVPRLNRPSSLSLSWQHLFLDHLCPPALDPLQELPSLSH